MAEPVCEQLCKWKQKGLGIDVIRLDNAGENKALQLRTDSEDWKLGIDCEFAARDAPQQNHLAEIAIANIDNKGRALMHREVIVLCFGLINYANPMTKRRGLLKISLNFLLVLGHRLSLG